MQHAVQRGRRRRNAGKVRLIEDCLEADVRTNLRRWWKDEISGETCVKNIMDGGFAVGARIAGIGGEIVGMRVGNAIGGPIGTAIGTIAGGVVSSACAVAGQLFSDHLTHWIFGLPKPLALQNAFRFLGLPQSSSNSEINTQYRKHASRYHPDKGGDKDKWTQLQYSLAIIRQARGAH